MSFLVTLQLKHVVFLAKPICRVGVSSCFFEAEIFGSKQQKATKRPTILTVLAFFFKYCRVLKGVSKVRGQLGNPEDSVWEDWGTLGKIRGITTPAPGRESC